MTTAALLAAGSAGGSAAAQARGRGALLRRTERAAAGRSGAPWGRARASASGCMRPDSPAASRRGAARLQQGDSRRRAAPGFDLNVSSARAAPPDKHAPSEAAAPAPAPSACVAAARPQAGGPARAGSARVLPRSAPMADRKADMEAGKKRVRGAEFRSWPTARQQAARRARSVSFALRGPPRRDLAAACRACRCACSPQLRCSVATGRLVASPRFSAVAGVR